MPVRLFDKLFMLHYCGLLNYMRMCAPMRCANERAGSKYQEEIQYR